MLRWFESTSSHQNEVLFKKYLVSFYINLIISHAGGFEQPVPDALRPVGQKHPCGVFLGRGLAGSPAPTKTRYFSRSISFLFYISLIINCAGGFEQPVPDALRPVGQKHLCGVFLGRGLADSPAPTKRGAFASSLGIVQYYLN